MVALQIKSSISKITRDLASDYRAARCYYEAHIYRQRKEAIILSSHYDEIIELLSHKVYLCIIAKLFCIDI